MNTRVPGTALAASSLAFCLVLLDTSLVNVALPTIRHDLGASVAGLQWIVNAFPLALATLLMSAGAFVDRFGARRLMFGGVAIFLVGSSLAGVANGPRALIAAQAGLGVGAALLLPASLSLLTHAYPDPARRAVAVGIWSSTAAVAFAASPLVAGFLIDVGGWRAVFAVNLPFAVAVVGLLTWHVPETPTRIGQGVDLAGQCTAMVALAALTFALIESRPLGWSSKAVLGSLAVFVIASVGFVAIERRSTDPMLPLGLFSTRGFSPSIAAGVLVSVSVYGQLFLLALYLQDGRGLSPTEMGLVYLAQPVATALIGIPIGRFIGRMGPRVPLIVGGAAGAVGSLLLAAVIGRATSYGVIVLALTLFGIAGGSVVPAVYSAVVSSVPSAQVGVASSVLNAARQTGGVLGIAVLGGLVSATNFVSGLPLAMALCALSFAGIALVGVWMRRLPRPAGLGSPAPVRA
jgi:DHA2 family methylenomycin A resistance protein-like MFS transporter